MYKSIVVGTDGSATAKGAVAEAAKLAKAFTAPLHLVSAFRPPAALAAGAAASGIAAGQEEWQILARNVVVGQLDAMAAELRADGIDVHTHALPVNPVDAILDIATSTESDVIVVGSKGMKGARRVLGSVPNSVAHKAPCAVLIVKTV
jgi:nucleotide-binding universal stress UspA family protein